MTKNDDDNRPRSAPPDTEIGPAADAARLLHDEWQRLAAGTGDPTLTRLNELLIKFNHEFHLAAERRSVTNHDLRIVLDEAIPEIASQAVSKAVNAPSSLSVEPSVVKASFEAILAQRPSD